jgi:SAM-dependent methyltransferase
VAAAIDALHLRTLREVSALLAAHAGHDDETAARAIGEGLAAIADAHGRAVAGVLRALDAHGPGPGFAFKEVVCAAHAWELQLALLGLDPDAIAEPILDLGCGEGAPLVTALRARGKDAIGVDRITVPTSHVVETDWFEFPIAPDRYGTVISHLAFSTQFLHHHLRPEGDAERYARKYMEILRGLRDGGVFAYAPGLPFLEGLLPADRFRVETRPIETPIPGPFGPVHATKVTRVRRA